MFNFFVVVLIPLTITQKNLLLEEKKKKLLKFKNHNYTTNLEALTKI